VLGRRLSGSGVPRLVPGGDEAALPGDAPPATPASMSPSWTTMYVGGPSLEIETETKPDGPRKTRHVPTRRTSSQPAIAIPASYPRATTSGGSIDR
jgi:hypothetical protein